MKNLLSLFSLSAVLLFAPNVHAAPSTDHFANAVLDSQMSFLSQEHATGAPDGTYADSNLSGTSLILDMGEGEEGLGNLTLYYETTDPQSHLSIDFLNKEEELLYTFTSAVPLGNVWMINYPLTSSYRYVRIGNATTNSTQGYSPRSIRIDAIESTDVALPEIVESEVMEEPEIINADSLAGSLVKLTDDWDETTNEDTTIYLLDKNNVRHLIPNETVFESWNLSSSDITVIGEGTLTGMPLGKNVYIRPSSNLVKIEASPRVYAVGDGGVLHWIQTEKLATELYGTNWATHVVDVPEILFVQYKKGADLTEAVFPAGSFVKTKGGSVWYIDGKGKRFSIGPKTLSALELPEDRLGTNLTEPEIATAHPYEGRLTYEDSQRWPF